MQRLGILRESGHEHFNGSLVFPIFDLDGDVLGMYGRKITPHLREGTPLHLYLPGPHRGVWNEAGAAGFEGNYSVRIADRCADVLVRGVPQCDGELWRERFYGRSQTAFAKHGVQHVWIAYDRDEAGDAAAEQLKKELAIGIGASRAVSEGHGCERIRAESHAGIAEFGGAAEPHGEPAGSASGASASR